MSEIKTEVIRIELTKDSAAVLGALLAVAHKEILQSNADVSALLESLRTEPRLKFSTTLESRLAEFAGVRSCGKIEIRHEEDGTLTVIEELN